jgi:glyoxylate utilization-related uncharacterized protein
LRHGVDLHPDESHSARNDHAAGPKVLHAASPGNDTRQLLSSAESRGEFEVTEQRVKAGASIERREEASELCLYVLEGNVHLTVGNEERASSRGAFAFVPRRTMLRVVAADAARLLLWRTPAR